METGMTTEVGLLRMAADIVSAYVGRNDLSADELPSVIAEVYDTLSGLDVPVGTADGETPEPAVTVGRSVKRRSILCLEDGKAFRALKRHLRAAHDMTPEEYRAKWGLRDDYPMVAPEYSAKRSELARKMGLGQKIEHRGGVEAA